MEGCTASDLNAVYNPETPNLQCLSSALGCRGQSDWNWLSSPQYKDIASGGDLDDTGAHTCSLPLEPEGCDMDRYAGVSPAHCVIEAELPLMKCNCLAECRLIKLRHGDEAAQVHIACYDANHMRAKHRTLKTSGRERRMGSQLHVARGRMQRYAQCYRHAECGKKPGFR